MSQQTSPKLHTCIFARGVISDFEVFKELVNLHSMQGQRKESDFTQALLCSSQRHNMELSKLEGTVTDGAPSVTGSRNVLDGPQIERSSGYSIQ